VTAVVNGQQRATNMVDHDYMAGWRLHVLSLSFLEHCWASAAQSLHLLPTCPNQSYRPSYHLQNTNTTYISTSLSALQIACARLGATGVTSRCREGPSDRTLTLIGGALRIRSDSAASTPDGLCCLAFGSRSGWGVGYACTAQEMLLAMVRAVVHATGR